MKLSVIVTTACAVALQFVCLHAQEPPGYFAEDYGALADDGLDDRGAIQSALEAAAAAGGGTVQLRSGVFDVVGVLARGYGPVTGFSQGTVGYHGLTVPPNCTLTGAGMTLTTVRTHAPPGSDPGAVGDCIINGGYQFALTDFGAGGSIVISHLRVEAADIASGPTGNLIGLAHADGVRISSVALGASKYHGLEINISRNVVVEDCIFDGTHQGSSTLQFDYGSVGAKSLRPTGTVVRDVLVRRCRFSGRSAELYGKVIELGHTGSACILRNIAFEDCDIESIGGPTSTCVTNDNPAAREMTGMRFERCHFQGVQQSPSVNGLLQFAMQGTQLLDDLTVRDCEFTGAFWQGLVVISTTPTFNTGHSQRHNILIEGNRFAPVLDREVPVSGGSMRMIAAAACADIIARRNLVECPATAANLSLSNFYSGIQIVNCLDARIEDNVLTWAHTTAATAPMGKGKHAGMIASAYQLEQSALKSVMRMTGNVFLYPVNGIAAAVYMNTSIPTTSWAPGGPWVGGLVGGNFASGAGSGTVWSFQHDLSGAANVGQILSADASRTSKTGWYPCNGAALTTLDSGNNSLARVNAGKCGYSGNLPAVPGQVIHLHGPLTGEGLLAAQLAPYAGSIYRGTSDSITEMSLIPFADLTQGDLRVTRMPLKVYRWEANIPADAAPPGSLTPADKTDGTPGFWVPLKLGTEKLADSADLDGDGLTNLEERAFLGDPSIPDAPDVLTSTRLPDDSLQISFRCASGAQSPRICLYSSEDMVLWQVESSCQPGNQFAVPSAGILTESPWNTGRSVTFQPPPATRRFWRVAVEP